MMPVQDTEDMWARKLQELTNMGVIPDYRSVRAHAAREGTCVEDHSRGPSLRHQWACAQQTRSG